MHKPMWYNVVTRLATNLSEEARVRYEQASEPDPELELFLLQHVEPDEQIHQYT